MWVLIFGKPFTLFDRKFIRPVVYTTDFTLAIYYGKCMYNIYRTYVQSDSILSANVRSNRTGYNCMRLLVS